MRYSFLALLLFIASCSVNLKDTIINVDTVNNKYLKIHNYTDHTVSIDILSYIIDTGDLQGIILYGSTNQNDINDIEKNDINGYFPDITKKPGYLLLQSPSTLNYNLENKQLTSFSHVSLAKATAGPFYIASSVLFKNPIYAAIHDNEGLFENKPSDVLTLFPKDSHTFNITNFANAPATGSVGYLGNDVVLSGTGSIQLIIESNTVNSTTLYSPAFNSSTATAQIANGGFLDPAEVDLYQDMSQLNYSSKVTISEKNIYFIKDGTNYFKIYVSKLSADPNSPSLGSITAPFSATIDVYYSAISNADKF